MTVINTAYCSIDEAWGDLVTKDNKESKRRRKKPPTDPICDLYESKISQPYNDVDLVRYVNDAYEKHDKSRYQRSMRPVQLSYEEEERQPQPTPTIVQENIRKYNSARPDLSNSSNAALFEKQFEIKLPPLYDGGDCPISQENIFESNVENTTYQEDDKTHHQWNNEEDDFDVYQQYQIPKTKQVRRRPRKESFQNTNRQEQFIFPDDYNSFDNDDDTYKYNNIKNKYSNIEVLDIILYVISGIILIFLMDQFVKIGISLQT